MTTPMLVLLVCAVTPALLAGVAIIRVGNRWLAAARAALAADRAFLQTQDRRQREAACAQRLAEERLAALDGWVAEAQGTVRTLEQRLYGAQQIPVERFHIFDRMDARPGVIWSVVVRRLRDAPPADPHVVAAWQTPRTYLIVAGSAREALDRAVRRFPRDDGFAVGPASLCDLFANSTQDGSPAGSSGAGAGHGGIRPHALERKSA